MDNGKFKARDVQPTVLRLHPDVRAELVRLAFVNGRSLSKEVATRLEASLKETATPKLVYSATPREGAAHPANDNGPAYALSGTDQAMLEVFRRMPVEKQLALLSLFR